MKTLTVTETALRLGAHVNYVYSLIRGKQLAATRVNGLWQIDAAAVEQRLAKRMARLSPKPKDEALREVVQS